MQTTTTSTMFLVTLPGGPSAMDGRVGLFMANARHLSRKTVDGVMHFPKHNEKRVRAIYTRFLGEV